jgi:hypothetical protein
MSADKKRSVVMSETQHGTINRLDERLQSLKERL